MNDEFMTVSVKDMLFDFSHPLDILRAAQELSEGGP